MLGLKKYFSPEHFLGLGFGLGYMTSLRILGPVGVGELFVLAAILLLFSRVGYSFLKFYRDLSGFIKLYLMASAFIILPLSTLLNIYMTSHNESQPQYIISFVMGVSLAFLVVTAISKNRFNPIVVLRTYSLSFLGSFFISYIFFPRYFGGDRFIGFSSDPNQLMFYVSSLSLLLVLYGGRLGFAGLPVLFFVGYLTGSDSYYLQLFLAALLSALFWFFFRFKYSFTLRLSGFILFFTFGFAILFALFGESIIDFIVNLWVVADNGGVRISLLANGFEAAVFSPLIGNGAGAFSGVYNAFEGDEAHNTFLDFATQFGFVFAIFIYYVIFGFVIKALGNRNYLIAGFAVAYIVSGMFHNNGRHFIFWFEFGLFFHYLFFLKSPWLRDKN